MELCTSNHTEKKLVLYVKILQLYISGERINYLENIVGFSFSAPIPHNTGRALHHLHQDKIIRIKNSENYRYRNMTLEKIKSGTVVGLD